MKGECWYGACFNTDGGVILLGVRESNHRFSVQGVSDADLLMKQIWDAVNNREVVSEDIALTHRGMESKLGLSKATIRTATGILVKHGYLRRVGAANGGHWELIDQIAL